MSLYLPRRHILSAIWQNLYKLNIQSHAEIRYPIFPIHERQDPPQLGTSGSTRKDRHLVPGTLNDVTVRPRALAFILRTVVKERERKRERILDNLVYAGEKARERIRNCVYVCVRVCVSILIAQNKRGTKKPTRAVLSLRESFGDATRRCKSCIRGHPNDHRTAKTHVGGSRRTNGRGTKERVDQRGRSTPWSESTRVSGGASAKTKRSDDGFEQWRNFRDWRLPRWSVSRSLVKRVNCAWCVPVTWRCERSRCGAELLLKFLSHEPLCPRRRFGDTSRSIFFPSFFRISARRQRKVNHRESGSCEKESRSKEDSPPDTHETYATGKSSIISRELINCKYPSRTRRYITEERYSI